MIEGALAVTDFELATFRSHTLNHLVSLHDFRI